MASVFEPIYINTFEKGLLRKKRDQAESLLSACTLCPRRCGVNRIAGETGVCKTGKNALV